jgi:hypothetical protein
MRGAAMYDLEGIIGGLTPDAAKQKVGAHFIKILGDEVTEKFLETLLILMKIKFRFDPEYRRNLENFRGALRFRCRGSNIDVLVSFADQKMKVSEDPAGPANVIITFRDSRALRKVITTGNIMGSLLNADVVSDGNINYLYKFGFLARHLVLEFTGKLPS